MSKLEAKASEWGSEVSSRVSSVWVSSKSSITWISLSGWWGFSLIIFLAGLWTITTSEKGTSNCWPSGPRMGTVWKEVSVGKDSEQVTGGDITGFTELWVSGILGEVVPFFSGGQVGMGRGGRNSSPGPFEYLEYT